jgi:hypothetical protein
MTASENPYELLADKADLPAAPPIEVDQTGTLLIVQSPAELPDRCVFTNEPTGPDDVVNYQLEWHGKKSFRLALTKRCRIQYSTLPANGPGGWQKLVLLGPVVWLVMHIFIVTAEPSPVELFLCSLVALILVAISSYMSRKNPRLEIVHFENGRFWLKGCAPEFLQQLQAERRADETVNDQTASASETA